MNENTRFIDTFIESFQEMVDTIAQNPHITITDFAIHPPATKEEIDNTLMPTILQKLYRQANGVTLRWESKEDMLVRGSIHIPSLEYSQSMRWKRYGNLDYGEYVHVVFNKKAGEDSLVLYEGFEGEDGEELIDLAGEITTIQEYLVALLKTFGYRYWQESYEKGREYTLDEIVKNRAFCWAS